jgi:hypothetical protein
MVFANLVMVSLQNMISRSSRVATDSHYGSNEPTLDPPTQPNFQTTSLRGHQNGISKLVGNVIYGKLLVSGLPRMNTSLYMASPACPEASQSCSL